MKTISAICITRNRRFYVKRAIRYWQRAVAVATERFPDWDFEFVLVDGSESPLYKENVIIANGSGVRRSVFAEGEIRQMTGPLHNLACERSLGDIIVQWDDDDWHAPTRLAKTIAALGHAEPTFLFTSKYYWYSLTERQGALAKTWGGGGGSVGATFAYHRALWEKVRFREIAEGEDGFFWQDCEAAKVPMVDLADPNLLIYIRHPQNGSPLWNEAWSLEATEACRKMMSDAGDLEFYDELAEILPMARRNEPRTPSRVPWPPPNVLRRR